MKEAVRYIISFLLGEENKHLLDKVGYTNSLDEETVSPIIIYSSGFFEDETYGTEKSIPTLPLKTWKGVPLLFGKNAEGRMNGKLIIYADIVASSYFLLSRYEEMVNRSERDQHGRFPGRSSLPYRAGFLHRPIVDEYANELLKILSENNFTVHDRKRGLSKIYLTHDVDQIAHYRNLRGMLGGVSRFYKNLPESFQAVQSYLFGIKHDPWFTFPWAFELSNQLKQSRKNIENILFIKTGGGSLQQDKPLHNIQDQDFDYLFQLAKDKDVKLGLHPSYQAGIDTHLIKKEKEILDETIGIKSRYTRNHFLANREPEDMQALIEAGFTDDFTMAYADFAGFRLGTCRAVKWINPITKKLTSLTLHPLSMMDISLDSEQYMGLDYENALEYAKNKIDLIANYGGELVLLWHNNHLEKRGISYHRQLYAEIINYLKNY